MLAMCTVGSSCNVHRSCLFKLIPLIVLFPRSIVANAIQLVIFFEQAFGFIEYMGNRLWESERQIRIMFVTVLESAQNHGTSHYFTTIYAYPNIYTYMHAKKQMYICI